jgi:hypothetical protein
VVCQIAIINSLEPLNQTLADTTGWRDMYKEASLPAQISRLLEVHQAILEAAAAEHGEDGMNDLFVSNIIRTNDAPAWFISEHLVDAPLPVAE